MGGPDFLEGFIVSADGCPESRGPLLQSGRMEKFNATSKQTRYTGKEKIVMNVDNNFCRRNEKWVVLLLAL
jgi:hypothetical protein